MADKYNTDFIRRLEDGPVRGGGVVLPCICEEGNITVYGSKTLSDGRTRRAESHFAFAAELEEGDKIYLPDNAAYTYDACEGMPVVAAVSGSGGVQGYLLDDPRKLVAMPATSAAADSVAERIAGKYYRIAMVWFPAHEYRAILANGQSANIAVGDVVTWDISDSVVVENSGTGDMTSAHQATADAVYVGVFMGLKTGDSQA